jgi:hypothetical protein
MQKVAIRGEARQIASAADDSANSRSSFVLWRFLCELVGATGFEPATPCAQEKYAWHFLKSAGKRRNTTRIESTRSDSAPEWGESSFRFVTAFPGNSAV